MLLAIMLTYLHDIAAALQWLHPPHDRSVVPGRSLVEGGAPPT
ncbi:hypothetical protein [Lichenibacterium ramalinae]|nr:hypothetical protein [Lichenibacterium ramalinae]